MAVYGQRFTLVDRDFGQLSELLETGFDGILFDLGVSSFQLDDGERGFSFRQDAPADMRMDPRAGVPASRWLETATEEMLVRAIRDYGEEQNWRRVVRALISARATGALARTSTLANLISEAIPPRDRHTSKVHPATRSFQGIRIAVNDELGAIERALPAAFTKLAPGGVLVVISFHSLEDRMVKQFIAKNAKDVYDRRAPFASPAPLALRDLGRQRPSTEEVSANPRSRSAILRVAERLPLQVTA
jgi:16S rRNA (cytosine1402-N4)-methyltransferase